VTRKDIRTVRVEDLSFEEKVGQMFFARTWKVFEDPRYARLIERGWLGSIQASPYPTFSREKVDRINETALLPVLVGADGEEGCPLPPPKGTALPPACGVAALGSAALAEEVGRITAREMMSAGINVIWGPVFDVNLLPDGVHSLRCYGNNMRQRVRERAAHG